MTAHHRQAYLRLVPLCALLMLTTLTAGLDGSAKAEELSPAKPYAARRSDAVTHDVDFTVVVTPPYHCQVLKVWLPLPQSDEGQTVTDSRLSTFPGRVEPTIAAEPVYGNRFAYFEFHDPHGAQIIRHRFKAKIWNLHWDVAADKVERVQQWPATFAPYLTAPELEHASQLDEVLTRIAPRRDQTADGLLAAMNWIDQNMTYDHVNASLRADADFAFAQRRGHCSDYHGLCATMGRKLGYPTRVTYGIAMVPKNSPSHCKLEAYLPPYGWVSFDLSETQKLVAKIQKDEALGEGEKQTLIDAARRRLRRGFRENSWLLVTRGTNYELAPKASRPVAVVRTIYAEADGQPLPDPDPANIEKREFAWMTAHKFSADKPFDLPFKDAGTLRESAE
ncbi:MAG: transglutaminase domain-containing protein [Pirellulaceae bacterium]